MTTQTLEFYRLDQFSMTKNYANCQYFIVINDYNTEIIEILQKH